MSLPKRLDIASRPGAAATHLALVVVQIAFAAGAVEGKLALGPVSHGGAGIDPVALAMARMVGGAAAFQALARLTKELRPVSRSDHWRIAGLGLLGVVLNQTLFLVGLRTTSAFAASILGATIPIFAAAFAVALRLERAHPRTGIGIALAIGGVLWLTGVGSLDYGALSIALNCVAYALYIVLAKPVIDRLGSPTVVAWLFTWGALIMGPFGGPPLARGAVHWGGLAWFFVAFFVAVPTIVAYWLNAWAIGRATPTIVTVYIYLQPVLAALLQWVQLGEPIATRALGATALIVLGVAVVASRPAVRVPLAPSAPPAP
jgi:drug/metabolite transporter (DMT)-like permease